MRSVLLPLLSVAAMTACAPEARGEPIVVFVQDDGTMLIDGRVVTAEQVRRRVGTNYVLLRADPTISYTTAMARFRELQDLNMPIIVASEAAPQ